MRVSPLVEHCSKTRWLKQITEIILFGINFILASLIRDSNELTPFLLKRKEKKIKRIVKLL